MKRNSGRGVERSGGQKGREEEGEEEVWGEEKVEIRR